MISKKLQDVLEDDFGMDVEEDIDENFNPKHPYFSVSFWGRGRRFDSHQSIESIKSLIAHAANSQFPDETFCFVILDSEGNRLRPNFSNITLERCAN